MTSVMRFVDRAQYSKSPHMVGQAASAAMGLAYAEPTVVLPLAIARFQQAVETVRAPTNPRMFWSLLMVN